MCAVESQPVQPRAALGERQVHQRAPVVPEQVEEDVCHGCGLCPTTDGRLAAQVHASLQQLEAGVPVAVEGHDLAVEDRAVGAERSDQALQLRVGGGDLVAVATPEAQPLGRATSDRAHPIPLDLERPVRVISRERRQAREHRLDELGHLGAGFVRTHGPRMIYPRAYVEVKRRSPDKTRSQDAIQDAALKTAQSRHGSRVGAGA